MKNLQNVPNFCRINGENNQQITEVIISIICILESVGQSVQEVWDVEPNLFSL